MILPWVGQAAVVEHIAERILFTFKWKLLFRELCSNRNIFNIVFFWQHITGMRHDTPRGVI